MNKFIGYRDRCKQGREHSRCIPVEHKVLAAVRIKEMITQSTHEEWLKEYGRNKRLSSASVPEEIKNLQMWSESSDDELDVETEVV